MEEKIAKLTTLCDYLHQAWLQFNNQVTCKQYLRSAFVLIMYLTDLIPSSTAEFKQLKYQTMELIEIDFFSITTPARYQKLHDVWLIGHTVKQMNGG